MDGAKPRDKTCGRGRIAQSLGRELKPTLPPPPALLVHLRPAQPGALLPEDEDLSVQTPSTPTSCSITPVATVCTLQLGRGGGVGVVPWLASP